MQSARCWIVMLLRHGFTPIVYLRRRIEDFHV
jgi:hypothetical protein